MLPTITCQVKQLLFFILLLKAHAQPPFASIQHQIKNALQHNQHHHSNHFHNKFYDKKPNNQQQPNNLFALVDLTLLEEHPKELNQITGKNSSSSLITYGVENSKYPVVEKFNSNEVEISSKNNKNKKNFHFTTDQYESNENSKKYNNQPISTSSLSLVSIPSELSEKFTKKSKDFDFKNLISKQTIKQLENSHQQQKREVILADVPFWPLKFPTTSNSVAASPNNNNNSHNYEDEIESPSQLIDYIYYKRLKDTNGIDENFSSKEISENEINDFLTPNEFFFLKELQKTKGLSSPSLSSSALSSNSKFPSQLSKKSSNKVVIEPHDDGGGGGGGGGDGDGGGRSNESEHKQIKFYLKSYPNPNKKMKITKKFCSNPYDDVDDNEDYDGNSNYNDGNNNNNINSNINNNNNRYTNNLNDEIPVIFNDKRITAPAAWVKMLRYRKDGRKSWGLFDQKPDIGEGGRLSYFSDPDMKSYGGSGLKRQKFKIHQTQFVPSVSVGAMTNLGDFFNNLKNNVDYIEKTNLSADFLDLMGGDHLRKMSEHIKAETTQDNSMGNNIGYGGRGTTGTAAFLHAIRTYRPSQKVRALVSMTPEGYHGNGQHFNDPNYMWMGLGK